MITQLTLKEAVSKIYGHTLIDSGSPVTQWQLFSPYSATAWQSSVLLKLLQVPAHLFTSEQICSQKLKKYKGVLHEIKLIFVERCFQSSFYLVIAEQNLISIKSLVNIKREANEKIDELIIYDFLQFANNLQNHPHASEIQFNEDQVAINSKGKFVLTNYLMYFEKDQNFANPHKQLKKKHKGPDCNLKIKIRQILTKMLLLKDEGISLAELYSTVEEKYDNNMVYLVQKCIETQFDTGQVFSLISSLKNTKSSESFSAATVTDSQVQDCEKITQNLTNNSCNITAIDESFRKIQKEKKSLERRKVMGFVFVFIIILIGIGAITFKQLGPRPLQCQENQYADQSTMKCFNCDMSCERCVGGQSSMCLSCKGAQFLIISNFNEKTGKCSLDCHGTIIKTKTCIDNH